MFTGRLPPAVTGMVRVFTDEGISSLSNVAPNYLAAGADQPAIVGEPIDFHCATAYTAVSRSVAVK